jgi:hypothetical protein
MCCHITANWHGMPLGSREVVISLIGDINTSAGLRIQAALDVGQYPTGLKVSNAEMKMLRIDRAPFHGEWNYTILPHHDAQSKTKRTRKA